MKKQLCTGITSLLLPLASYGATSQTGAYQRSTARSGFSTEAALPLLDQPASSPAVRESAEAIDPESLRIVQGSTARELLIIDEAVPNQSTFYRALRPGVAVAKINTDRHGLKQLRAILADHQSLEAVHIVSHAEDGVLHLGNSRVTADSVKTDMELFAALNGSVKAGGDLLFYGCNLAATEKGEQLLDIIAGNTQLDVAASNDLTGNTEQRGDWELEISRGRIESTLAFSEKSLKDFSEVLAPETYNSDSFCTAGCGYPAQASYTSADGDFVFTGTANGSAENVYAFDGSRGDHGLYLSYETRTNGDISGSLIFTASNDVYSFELASLNYSTYGGGSCTGGSVVGYVAGGGTVSEPLIWSGTGNSASLGSFAGVQITHFHVNGTGCSPSVFGGMGVASFAVDNKQGANSAPTDISLDSTSIDQNVTGAGAVIGNLSTTDADGSDTHTYALVADGASDNGSCGAAGDDDNASFQVDNANDDFETAGSVSPGTYNVCIETDDGTASYQESFTISVPLDSDGSLTASATVTEPVPLSTTVDSTGEAVDIFDFTLSDGGSTDGQPMTISQVVVNVTGTSTDAERAQITWRLNGNDANNVTGTYDTGTSTITFSSLSISVADGGSEIYTINAYYNDNTNLTEDNTIVLSVDGDTDLTVGSSGTQMGSTTVVNNGTGTTIDVTATQLAFTTQPDGSVSGNALTTQPVVTAQDDFGNTDVDFSETITLTEASAGSLGNNTQSASDGVATFTDVTYTATSDQESFTLTANDQDGVGSDLPTMDANAVTSDVVATQLVFDTQPAPTEVTSDEPTAFTTVPTVSAVDAEGVVDTGYGTDITLSVTDPNDGTVDGTVNSLTATGDTDGDGTTVSLTPASGAATFTGLTLDYSAASLSDDLALSTISGGLSTAESTALTAVQLPSVTDANISVSGATGTDGAYITGDTVTATWDSSASGDDNSDLTGVTVDFSEFGGGAAVTATDSGGVWSATHTITSGNIDATEANVSVTASNVNGDTTTADTTDATLDNEAPALTDDGLSLSGASGNDGVFVINDTLTATWDTSIGGNGNTDIDTVTVDFTELGGGSAVTATQSGDQWQADLDIEPGSLEADNLNVSFTATDDAGNSTTLADTSNASLDNQAPSVTGSQPGSETRAADTSVDFVVNFDETVENLSAGDFTLTTTGSATGTVDGLSASAGDNVTVTITGVSGDGTLRLDYTGTGATDAAGNTLGSFTSGTEHTVDTEAPDAPGLTFNQNPVTEANADNISLTLAGAETGTSADYTVTSDGGGTAVTGSANITSADQTLTGIDVSGLGDGTLSAEITLTDDAGNVSDAGTATATKDANAPVVESVEATDGHYAEGDTLTIVVELNEDVEVSGTNATLDIDIGPNTHTAGFASKLDSVLQFNYTVQADDNTDDNGVTVLADSITLNGDTITDGAGNDAELTFASNSNADAQVDTLEPDETTVTAPSEAVSVNEADYTIAGDQGESGIVINLYADANEDGVPDDDTVLESATVEDGNWSVGYTLNPNTDNALVAVAEDSAGNVADPVRVPVITHDDIAPDAPEDLALETDSDSGADDSDRITNVTTPEINGTAEAAATVTLSSDLDGEIGTATANENGDWSLTADELSEGEHELTATATDAADNTGGDSDALTLTIDATAPTLGEIADQSSPAGQSTGALTLELDDEVTDAADLELEATSSDTNVVPEANIALADSEGERTIEVTPDQPGSATITLEAEDLAGNQAGTSFLISVNTPPSIDGAPPASAVEGQPYEFVPNASDADGDTLAFSIAGQPSWLSFDPATGTLSGTPTQGAIGQYSDIQISVTDGTASASLAPFSIEVSAGVDSDGDGVSDYQEGLDGTDPNDPDDYLDETPPELTAPTDLVLNAKALYTRVTLAQLLGLDAEAGDEQISLALDELASDDFDGEGCCNPTVEGMADNRLLLAPGEHQVVWQAEDRKGNRTEVAQSVYLRPLVSLSKNQTTVEGNRVTFSVILNGESPFYPMNVPYVIDETASSAGTDDHDLSDGTVTFEEGETRVQVSLNISDDSVGEGEETLVVRLDDRTSGDEDLADGYDFDNPDIYDINRGAKAEHRIVIAEGNIAPRLAVTLEQDGERRLLIARDGGPVTATAEVIDPNAGDSHELDWSESNNVLTDTDGDNRDETFVFDPVDLNPGRYSLALRATDSAGDTGSRRRHFVVVPAPPVLSEGEDRNNNGLSDAEEGAGDENDNGIPDYRDNAPSPNVLPEEANGTPDYLMECDAGVVCGLGRFSLLGETGGSRLTDEDIEEQDGLVPDTSYEPVGGIFDFEVNELPETGQSVSIAIPLREPVPADAVYRKYIDGQWRDFVEDEFNQLHSAAGDPGYCPPPGDSAWQEGLAEGHHCVQLTLEDGGPNDADGEANGAVADPGAVSRATDEPDEPGAPGEDPDEDPDQPDEPGAEDPGAEDPGYDGEVTTRSSGGGSTGAWLILSLLGLGLLRRRRLGRRLGALVGVPLLSLALMGAPLESVAEEVDPIADMRFELGLYNADSSLGAGDFTRRMAGSGAPIKLSQYDVSRRAISLGIEFPLAHEFSWTLGYLNLGKAQARFHTQVDSLQRLQEALDQHYPYSTKGWTLGKRLRLPLDEQVNLLAEVGLYRWHSNVSAIGPAIEQGSTEGIDPLLGLGLEMPLNPRVSAGLKFKRVFFDNQQVDLMGATLNWRF